jgi:hypothetical protein
MAALLYPVDLSSFARPEKDQKFSALVMALQKQMGEAPTGILTSAQFDKLYEAARDLGEMRFGLAPYKMVTRSDDGNSVAISGTGVANDLTYPINSNRMLCIKSVGTCEMAAADLDVRNIPMLLVEPPVTYEVKTWTRNRITAIKEHPCATAILTVDVDAEDVTITVVPHTDYLPYCDKEQAYIWKLVDGFPVAWNIYRERYNKARALVYEPARKLVWEVQPAK